MREVAKFTTKLVKFDSWEEVADAVKGVAIVKVVIDDCLFQIIKCGDGGCTVVSAGKDLIPDEIRMEKMGYADIDLEKVVGALYDGETDGDYSGYNFEG